MHTLTRLETQSFESFDLRLHEFLSEMLSRQDIKSKKAREEHFEEVRLQVQGYLTEFIQLAKEVQAEEDEDELQAGSLLDMDR